MILLYVFIDLNCFLGWAMLPMGLLFVCSHLIPFPEAISRLPLILRKSWRNMRVFKKNQTLIHNSFSRIAIYTPLNRVNELQSERASCVNRWNESQSERTSCLKIPMSLQSFRMIFAFKNFENSTHYFEIIGVIWQRLLDCAFNVCGFVVLIYL